MNRMTRWGIRQCNCKQRQHVKPYTFRSGIYATETIIYLTILQIYFFDNLKTNDNYSLKLSFEISTHLFDFRFISKRRKSTYIELYIQ